MKLWGVIDFNRREENSSSDMGIFHCKSHILVCLIPSSTRKDKGELLQWMRRTFLSHLFSPSCLNWQIFLHIFLSWRKCDQGPVKSAKYPKDHKTMWLAKNNRMQLTWHRERGGRDLGERAPSKTWCVDQRFYFCDLEPHSRLFLSHLGICQALNKDKAPPRFFF